MAVLDDLPGLGVSICIDGQPVEEYNDDEEEEVAETPIAEYQAAKTISKFVESISDKEFSIRIALESPFVMDYDSLLCPIHIDGKWRNEPVLQKVDHPISIQGSRVVSRITRTVAGVKDVAPGNLENEFVRNFKFAKIDISTDDDKLAQVNDDMKRVQEVGEVIVKIYRGSKATDITETTNAKSIDSSAMANKFHEKALKGDPKSHSTSFGPAITLVKKRYLDCKTLDGLDYPIAIFRFKYRSRDALKSLLIIERSPSPEPEEAPVPEPGLSLDNLNAAQKTRLEQFLRELVNGDSGRNTPNRTIKRERTDNEDSAARKRRRSGPPVTIDLTDD